MLTSQSELQYVTEPFGPSFRPSYIHAQPTKAQVVGTIL